jgi:5-methylcytosine-specific restriction endonuclease McrA
LGRPKCRHGEDSERYANRACKTCALERATKWAKENPEKVKANQRLFSKRHPEKKKEYAEKNKQILLEKKKAYRERKKDHILLSNRLYKKNNKAIVNACNASRRGKIRGAEGRFSLKDVSGLLSSQQGKCRICGIGLTRYHIDHIIPVSRGGGNGPDNIQLLCAQCNLRKGYKLPSEMQSSAMFRTGGPLG